MRHNLMVAFRVFAPGATDDGRFEDYARQMYPHYARHNVPTYLSTVALAQDACAGALIKANFNGSFSGVETSAAFRPRYQSGTKTR